MPPASKKLDEKDATKPGEKAKEGQETSQVSDDRVFDKAVKVKISRDAWAKNSMIYRKDNPVTWPAGVKLPRDAVIITEKEEEE